MTLTAKAGACSPEKYRFAQYRHVPGEVGEVLEDIQNGQPEKGTASITAKQSKKKSYRFYRLQVPTTTWAAADTSKIIYGEAP